jgi:ankyrin repeat protein
MLQKKNNMSALHYASRFGHAMIVAELLRAGADANERNKVCVCVCFDTKVERMKKKIPKMKAWNDEDQMCICD